MEKVSTSNITPPVLQKRRVEEEKPGRQRKLKFPGLGEHWGESLRDEDRREAPDRCLETRTQEAQGSSMNASTTSNTRGTVSNTRTNTVSSEGCHYRRGGWCTTHNRRGEKVIKTTKTWELLGSGLHGYRLKRKVTWECRSMAFSGQNLLPTTPRDEFETTASVGILRGISVNFTALERTKRGRDSLEPRLVCKRARLKSD